MAEFVRTGSNTIVVKCQNEGGPAGLVMRIDVRVGGATRSTVTDSSWTWSGGNAIELGEYGMSPWGQLGVASGGVPEQATPVERITLPPGFEAELVYSVPKASEDSWVSMTFDPQGHVIASGQYGALYRLVPPPIGSGDEPLVTRIPVELGHAQGLLCAFDSLYAVVHGFDGRPSGLYRARDTDGDGEYDSVELLRELAGSGEHGPHAVRVGPDGESLYVIAGNHTRLPEIESSRVPSLWEEDQLLPRVPDPNGHARGVMAPGGWVCRTDPDGKEWELVACGDAQRLRLRLRSGRGAVHLRLRHGMGRWVAVVQGHARVAPRAWLRLRLASRLG